MTAASNNRSLWSNPYFYLVSSSVFYGVFEGLNATVVCGSLKIISYTGLFSFLGFWALAISVVLTALHWRKGDKKPLLVWLYVAMVIVLFVLDATIGKTCHF